MAVNAHYYAEQPNPINGHIAREMKSRPLPVVRALLGGISRIYLPGSPA